MLFFLSVANVIPGTDDFPWWLGRLKQITQEGKGSKNEERYTVLIPERQRQADLGQFQASRGYEGRPCPKIGKEKRSIQI